MCCESETDVSSIRSVQSNGSRKSERIAQRPPVSYAKSVEARSASKSQYICDVVDCDAAYGTERGLNIHKAKLHHTNTRKSTRKHNQKRKCIVVDAEDLSMQTKHIRVHTTAHTLHCRSAECSEAVMENTHLNETKKPKSGNLFDSDKTKQRTKCTFSAKIAELEKEFLPSKKLAEQTDPLYDKLKAYHDRLLNSVSNTTTRKLSAEVIDVIKNPAVIDDCDRQFLWSDKMHVD